MTADPYETLGVSRDAGAADFKKAYRELAREPRHDRMVNDESMPVVLDLPDQLYAPRRDLREVLDDR